jgi:hypothetical protein
MYWETTDGVNVIENAGGSCENVCAKTAGPAASGVSISSNAAHHHRARPPAGCAAAPPSVERGTRHRDTERGPRPTRCPQREIFIRRSLIVR